MPLPEGEERTKKVKSTTRIMAGIILFIGAVYVVSDNAQYATQVTSNRVIRLPSMDTPIVNSMEFSQDIKTDDKTESLFIDPAIAGISWEAAINGDFAHPIPVIYGSGAASFGNGVKTLNLRVIGDPRNVLFVIKHIPK